MTFEDHVPEPGRYVYRLSYTDEGNARTSTEVVVKVPSAYVLALAGFAPNPTTGSDLRIAFTLPKRAPGSLAIYDVAGREIHREDIGELSAGSHFLPLGSTPVPAGVYWLQLDHDGKEITRRGVVIR